MASDAGLVWLLAPAVLLAGGAWLRSVPGEWSRTALVAWLAMALAFFAGVASAVPVIAAAGLLLAFLALALGGRPGLTLLVIGHLTLALADLVPAIAWPLPTLLALSGAFGLAAATWRR